MTARAVVVDIEGTTSSTPRSTSASTTTPGPGSSRGSRPTPATRRWPRPSPRRSPTPALTPGAATADVVAVLHSWMDADLKATPLKTLQGQIWAAGFAAGELAAHVFADVAPRLRAWHADGVAIAVYSSGSVASQRAWFAHTDAGDLSGLIVAYFDTVNAGAKRDHGSYAAIAASLGVAPERRVVPVGRARRARRGRRRRMAGDRRAPRRRAGRGMGLRPAPGRGLLRRGRAVTLPDREELLTVGARLAAEAARFSALGLDAGDVGQSVRSAPHATRCCSPSRPAGATRASCGPTTSLSSTPGARRCTCRGSSRCGRRPKPACTPTWRRSPGRGRWSTSTR